jgi:hypothetical protein
MAPLRRFLVTRSFWDENVIMVWEVKPNTAYGRIDGPADLRRYLDGLRAGLPAGDKRTVRAGDWLPPVGNLFAGSSGTARVWSERAPEMQGMRFYGANRPPKPVRVRATGAFESVVELGRGGALLQATPEPLSYDAAAARRVFGALAPVLSPGLPRPLPGEDARLLVLADATEWGDAASQARAGRSVADLPVGSGPWPTEPAITPTHAAAISEFVNQAMQRGWITTEPADTVIPDYLRDAMPGHARLGLTDEGQRHLAALVERYGQQ